MAIISSYSESCGNAAFTKILHDSIEYFHKNIDVEVIELDLKLLQSIDRATRKQADQHINEIFYKIKKFDLVNIQMEAGLYGTLPQDIVKRFRKIVSANPLTSVTLHSPRLIRTTQSTSRSGIKKLLQLNIIGGLKDILNDKYSNIHFEINKKIIKASIRYQVDIIVHTERAKKQIRDFFSYQKTTVHPLKIVPEGYVQSTKKLADIKEQLGLEKDDIIIGMFGYINSYKGHIDAIKALKLMPKNHKLLIFGRQHPQTIKSDGHTDGYLNLLIETILNHDKPNEKRKEKNKTIKLSERIFFIGELADKDFLDVASSVDVAWLPYYENGQDGSGIASICFDLCPRVLCSTSFAFDELFKLIKYNNIMRFDIGNILEMVIKTKMILNKPEPSKPFADEHLFNLKTQTLTYVKGLLD